MEGSYEENSPRDTEGYLDRQSKLQVQKFSVGSTKSPVNFDNIRQTSGNEIRRDKLAITIDNKCLGHSQSGLDTHLTLKLFKVACLAYKPSSVHYREMVLERSEIIKLRRSLIDRLTNLLPQCDLFYGGAHYPRRYFDDLMVGEGQSAKTT